MDYLLWQAGATLPPGTVRRLTAVRRERRVGAGPGAEAVPGCEGVLVGGAGYRRERRVPVEGTSGDRAL